MKKIILIFGVISIFSGCNSSDPSKENSRSETPVKLKSTLSDSALNSIIETIPSPLELASLIQNTGASFTESFLNNTDNISKYNSQFSKALNLGIYGADLGYVNLYEKTFSSIDYLNTVYQLATDLNIGDFFDFNTLKRLATNNKNLDSIVYITTMGFEKMQNQLKKTHDSQISVLILIGGWIEGIYLTTGIVQNTNTPESKDLMITVYDEHIVLDDLVKLVNAYKDNPNFDNLASDLTNLKKVCDDVVIEKSRTDKPISQEQFNKIAKEVKIIRNKLIE